MKKTVEGFDADGMRSPREVRRLCLKVANQAGKGYWWNAMAAATELVAACQTGCRVEVDRVAQKRKPKKAKASKKSARA